MRFDTHQHFWELANPFTDWPTPDLQKIHRDFGPDDLRPNLEFARVEGTILVQAAPCLDETHYCLQIAADNDFVKGVVGWIDFEADSALAQLSRLQRNPFVKGLRPMVQSISEPGWLLKPGFDQIYETLIEYDLSLDGLVRSHQIGDLDLLAKRHPQLRIVLDHAGKPPIASGNFDPWASAICDLAENQNVHCKLSGLLTEAGSQASSEMLRPWVAHLLNAFGPKRLMWGSDWPVVEQEGSYSGWHAQSESLLAALPESERAAIMGDNGRRFYGLA